MTERTAMYVATPPTEPACLSQAATAGRAVMTKGATDERSEHLE